MWNNQLKTRKTFIHAKLLSDVYAANTDIINFNVWERVPLDLGSRLLALSFITYKAFGINNTLGGDLLRI